MFLSNKKLRTECTQNQITTESNPLSSSSNSFILLLNSSTNKPILSKREKLHPDILSIQPDQIRHLHTTHNPDFLRLAESSSLWPNSHFASDVIISVLDTGIWPKLQSFSDESLSLSTLPSSWKGSCEATHDFPKSSSNGKIIGAKAFYKGYEAYLQRPIDETVESKSPRDTEGHGTHTASTAAGSIVINASLFHFAKGEAKGMLTKARTAAYKICWKLGCFDSDILAAMDEAVSDGVHVISLSVSSNGYASHYYRDSTAIGVFSAAQYSVVVSCSAGNSGPGPYTSVNIAPWILTVGASTIDIRWNAIVEKEETLRAISILKHSIEVPNKDTVNRLGLLLVKVEGIPFLLVLGDVWKNSEPLIEKLQFLISDFKILVTSRVAFLKFSTTCVLKLREKLC